MKYQLAVAHRVCPVLAKTASHFTDKFEMVKTTTLSLAEALEGIRTKLCVILDGCDHRYQQLFEEVFSAGRFADITCEFMITDKIGNHPTYAKQVEWLTAQLDEAEYLYFSEDDYLYRKDAFVAMMDFLTGKDVDFVTPLDHPDRYSHFVAESILCEVRVSAHCHWRTVGTTCCTFMTKGRTFRAALREIASYGRGAGDGELWLGLTKDCLFSLKHTVGVFIRYLLGHRGGAENWGDFIPLAAWRFHKWRPLFTPTYRLWGPLPSLAVHLCVASLPPMHEKLMKDRKGIALRNDENFPWNNAPA